MERRPDIPYNKAEPSYTRLDKLFSDRFNEESTNGNRQTFTNNDTSDNMEAMESAIKARMGIKEVGNKQGFGETNVILW